MNCSGAALLGWRRFRASVTVPVIVRVFSLLAFLKHRRAALFAQLVSAKVQVHFRLLLLGSSVTRTRTNWYMVITPAGVEYAIGDSVPSGRTMRHSSHVLGFARVMVALPPKEGVRFR